MTITGPSNPNIRTEIKRNTVNTDQRSIVLDKEYFDCVNIHGPVDNSDCEDTNNLCNCPCTGGNPDQASAVPLFVEPTDEEMEWAKKQVSICFTGDDDAENIEGYLLTDPESLLNSCGAHCHGTNFYSFMKTIRTYSTFWDTGKKTPLYRNALLNLYAAQKATCSIPGNLNIKLGDFIVIPWDGTAVGKLYSGAWLIAGINHNIISYQNYKMVLTLVRDSRIDEIIEKEEE